MPRRLRTRPVDCRGQLHPIAREITRELTALWDPPPPPVRAALMEPFYLPELLGFTPSCWQGDVPTNQGGPVIRTNRP